MSCTGGYFNHCMSIHFLFFSTLSWQRVHLLLARLNKCEVKPSAGKTTTADDREYGQLSVSEMACTDTRATGWFDGSTGELTDPTCTGIAILLRVDLGWNEAERKYGFEP